MSPWLTIVGIGEDGVPGLGPAARAAVEAAEVLIGGERHLAMVPPDGRERLAWPSPLSALVERIESFRGRRVCVLATGDPLCYGVGTTLARRIPLAELRILPAPSAFSLACARLGWSLPEVDSLTLHGRPLALLQAWLQPGARLLVLCDDGSTPAQAAALLTAGGWGPSRLTVLEHMGGEREGRLEGTAEAWTRARVADFATLAIECRPEPGAALLPRTPGLPDEAFRSDGQLTKREVRAATLAALAPVPGQLLWDVGAGSGSVAVEWMRCDPRNRAIAVEAKAERRAFVAENAEALGAPKLAIVAGRAPEALQGLEAPDAAFLGGGIDTAGVFEAAWSALKPGGRLVANVVTLEGEARLLALHAIHGGELVRLAVSRAEPVGPFHGWRPLMTVTQWRLSKGREARP